MAVAGPLANLDYKVAHGGATGAGARQRAPPMFIVVRNAGTGEADGVYKPADRMWLDHDVYQNRYGDCIISREAHASPKTGEVKHGFVLGKDGRPLYGAKTERQAVPATGWRVFQGHEPAPEIVLCASWADACQHGSWYFNQEARNAAKGGHWKVVVMMIDRAFDCHASARPKGRGDARQGGQEWSQQLCEMLGTRSEALLHLQEYKRALVDACAAVHFVAAFEWSKARTRGVTACLNLGVEEAQAKLLMEDFCKRGDRDFPGVQGLEPVVDHVLERARRGELKPVELRDETPDDGRLYFRVVDPEDCKLRAGPDWKAKVVGEREFDAIVRGEAIVKDGQWLELHVSEEYDDTAFYRKAYAPMFTLEEDPEDREEVLERLAPREYPRRPRWEELGLAVRPLGLKPHAGEIPPDYCRWEDLEPPKNQREWPYVYKHGLAIACVVRGASDMVIDSFVRFHWVTGWNHIFLLFDDPDDKGIAHASLMKEFTYSEKANGVGLSVIKMDKAWWAGVEKSSRFYQRREKNDYFEGVCKLHEKHGDIESRQLIAIDQAVVEAHAMGIDWFAHIDIDECIYTPKAMENSSRRFLGSKERTIECVRLWNYEAVPEDMDCQDWFRECTLFQVSQAHCQGFKPPREYDDILRKREGRELEPPKDRSPDWWDTLAAKIHLKRQGTARKIKLDLPTVPAGVMPSLDGMPLPPGTTKPVETFLGFAAYRCGKCVVRMDPHSKPPLPWSKHAFVADNGDMLREVHQANAATDAVILHYPNAGYACWKEKYRALGEIRYVRSNAPRLHLASSQVVLHRPVHNQELFYKAFVMQNEHSELAFLAEHGLAIRISGVKELLEFYDKEHELPEVLPGQVEMRDPQSGVKFGR